MKLQQVQSYIFQSSTILNEGWQYLTAAQWHYIVRWE